MAIPSLLATVGESTRPGAAVVRGNKLHQLSIGIAIILLVCYIAYIAYSVFGVRAGNDQSGQGGVGDHKEPDRPQESPLHVVGNEKGGQDEAGDRKGSLLRNFIATFAIWWRTTYWLPIAVLAGVTAVTAVVSEVLVSTIEPVAQQIGLNPFFVGLIILPIVGNAAEHFSAITSAARNHMEISMAITAGSSIQIALLAAPILVLAGPLIGVPLDLNFSLLEVALFGLVTGLYALISLDGESTWLEGLLLCAFYLILAVGTFFTPT
jgi:Ca2+:H+ antiporter